MEFNSIYLFVSDVEISRCFYEDILGQIVTKVSTNFIEFEKGITLWQVKSNHIISQNNKKLNDRNFKFELYFENDDLDTIEGILQKNNIEFLHSIHEETWGQKTIRFFDPDNNLIEIGETPKSYIQRLYAENMTIEDISKKTDYDFEAIKLLLNVRK